MPQRYSLTFLTIIGDPIFHIFLQFEGLKNFYFASFSLSKVFIYFRRGNIFRSLWHSFCMELADSPPLFVEA